VFSTEAGRLQNCGVQRLTHDRILGIRRRKVGVMAVLAVHGEPISALFPVFQGKNREIRYPEAT
jgi:hypothetical protein